MTDTAHTAHALAAYLQQVRIHAALDAAFSNACGSLNRFDDADKLPAEARAAGTAYAAQSSIRHAAFNNWATAD